MDTLQYGSYRTEQQVDEFLDSLRGQAERAQSNEDFTDLLNSAYGRNIVRVTEEQHPRDNESARWILATIRDARRPLTTAELRTALALLQHGTTEKTTITWSEISNICQGLVGQDDMQNVRFLHGTLRTYLESPASKAQAKCPDANEKLSAICVQYLMGLEVPGQCHDKESLQKRLRDLPFYDYAAKHWGDHTQEACSQQSEAGDSSADVTKVARFGNVLDFLRNDQKVQAAFQIATVPSHALQTLNQQDALEPSPDLLRLSIRAIPLVSGQSAFPSEDPYITNGVIGLHMACLYDLVWAVGSIIEDLPQSLKVTDCRRRQALHFAAEGGSTGAIRKLIEVGSNVCDTDERGLTPLMLASLFKQDDVVKELIKHGGINVNAASSAADRRETLFLPMLRLSGIDADIPLFPNAKLVGSVGLRTALHWAAREGNLEIVDQLLPVPDIDVNARDSDGQTPYHKAAKKGHLKVVRRLLTDPRIDPFQTIGSTTSDNVLEGETALHLAAIYPGRGDEVAEYLVTEYPRLGTMLDKCKVSPLHNAIMGGSLHTVQILLDKDTMDTNSSNSNGMCPSEMAAFGWGLTPNERFDLFLTIWRHPKTQKSTVHPDDHLANHRDDRFYKIVQNRTEQWDPDPIAQAWRPAWRRKMASQKAQKGKLDDFYSSTPRRTSEYLDMPYW